MIFPQTACAFYVHTPVNPGYHAVAVQIEDFKNSSSSGPLSSVPLQFNINFNASVTCSYSCSFVSPTPLNGDALQSQNGSLQFIARAKSNFSYEM